MMKDMRSVSAYTYVIRLTSTWQNLPDASGTESRKDSNRADAECLSGRLQVTVDSTLSEMSGFEALHYFFLNNAWSKHPLEISGTWFGCSKQRIRERRQEGSELRVETSYRRSTRKHKTTK